MITITPQGTIHLVKCPLEQDYLHQFLWKSKQEQDEYFAKETRWSFDNYTYLKKDGVVKVSHNIDEIIDCSYLYYRNVGFTTKTYYCFITKMEYVNENCTAIYFVTDVFQTWQFDGNGNSLITYNKCFVEREHVLNDDIGANCIPEGLETGEYVQQATSQFDYGDNLILVQSSNRLKNYYQDLYYDTTNLGGIYYQGCVYVCSTQTELDKLIAIYNGDGQIDSIYNVYICPSNFLYTSSIKTCNVYFDSTQQQLLGQVKIYAGNSAPILTNLTINLPTKLDGYKPYNNKLFTFPYSYMLASNNEGSSNVYHYENFTNPSSCVFKVNGIGSVGASSMLTPINYYQTDNVGNSEEAIMGAKFPTLNWNSDNYTNWLSQNAVNMAVGVGTSLVNSVTTGMTTGVVDVTSPLSTITSDLLAMYEHSFNPNSARGNTNGGDIGYCRGLAPIKIYQYCPRQELSRAIDRYWCMYGYRVNTLKVPEINSRKLWNYVKTIGCNFTANIPQEDLNRIRQMFNDGVTLWHTTDMYNYDLDNNTIVTSNEERKESD